MGSYGSWLEKSYVIKLNRSTYCDMALNISGVMYFLCSSVMMAGRTTINWRSFLWSCVDSWLRNTWKKAGNPHSMTTPSKLYLLVNDLSFALLWKRICLHLLDLINESLYQRLRFHLVGYKQSQIISCPSSKLEPRQNLALTRRFILDLSHPLFDIEQ